MLQLHALVYVVSYFGPFVSLTVSLSILRPQAFNGHLFHPAPLTLSPDQMRTCAIFTLFTRPFHGSHEAWVCGRLR
jgi:hypothetical protein